MGMRISLLFYEKITIVIVIAIRFAIDAKYEIIVVIEVAKYFCVDLLMLMLMMIITIIKVTATGLRLAL